MRTREMREMFHALIQLIAKAIDERTPYNAAHTRNMVYYGRNFIKYLNKRRIENGEPILFQPSHEEEFLTSVWLHDIGKLVTPRRVMNKASRLTAEEKENIRHRFTLIGLQEKIHFLEKKISAAEKEKTRADIEQAWQKVCYARDTAQLSEEMIREIEQLGNRTYTDENGETAAWLTADEIERLSIRRGTLTEAERKVMEEHVVLTAKLLKEINFRGEYARVPEWASCHHELLDGSGYPNHLTGEEIPMEVRILSILDIFDALTADDRPYKPGVPVEEALCILGNMAETEGKLDKALVREFQESRCWVRA